MLITHSHLNTQVTRNITVSRTHAPSSRLIDTNALFSVSYANAQVICGVGRENIESWGRRRRSVDNKLHTYETDDEMTLSREILVLDFNDPADASKSTMDPFEVDGKQREGETTWRWG